MPMSSSSALASYVSSSLLESLALSLPYNCLLCLQRLFLHHHQCYRLGFSDIYYSINIYIISLGSSSVTFSITIYLILFVFSCAALSIIFYTIVSFSLLVGITPTTVFNIHFLFINSIIFFITLYLGDVCRICSSLLLYSIIFVLPFLMTL